MAVEQPKDFAYGYDVKPLAPAPNEHDSARSAVNLTAGLALQALAREGASRSRPKGARAWLIRPSCG